MKDGKRTFDPRKSLENLQEKILFKKKITDSFKKNEFNLNAESAQDLQYEEIEASILARNK